MTNKQIERMKEMLLGYQTFTSTHNPESFYFAGYEAAMDLAIKVLVPLIEREIHRCGDWHDGSKALKEWRGE